MTYARKWTEKRKEQTYIYGSSVLCWLSQRAKETYLLTKFCATANNIWSDSNQTFIYVVFFSEIN